MKKYLVIGNPIGHFFHHYYIIIGLKIKYKEMKKLKKRRRIRKYNI